MLIPMALYKVDTEDNVSPPSSTAFVGLYTSSNSWMAAFMQKLYLKEDTWRIELDAGTVSMHQEVVPGSPPAPSIIPILNQGGGVELKVLRKIWQALYGGLQYSLTWNRTRAEDAANQPYLDQNPTFSYEYEYSQAPSLVFNFDTRDNQFSAQDGFFLETSIFQAIGALSDSDYGYFSFASNHYMNFFQKSLTLASRLYYYKTWNDTPYFALANYGSARGIDMRGYTSGKYLGSSQIDGQVEARYYPNNEKLGFAGFFGVGKVAQGIGTYGESPILLAGGVGLRYMLLPKQRLPLRLDWAMGRDGGFIYFGVGEIY